MVAERKTRWQWIAGAIGGGCAAIGVMLLVVQGGRCSPRSLRMRVVVSPDSQLASLEVRVVIPVTLPWGQEVCSLQVEPHNATVVWRPSGAVVTWRAERCDSEREFIARVQVGGRGKRSENVSIAWGIEPRAFLESDRWVQAEAVEVGEVEQRLPGQDSEEFVEAAVAWMRDNMQYKLARELPELGAVNALRLRRGDCSDYADVLAALCRRRGIPAAVCFGARWSDLALHAWNAVYLRDKGWRVVDVTRGESEDVRFADYVWFGVGRFPELEGARYDWTTWNGVGEAEVKYDVMLERDE